MKRDWRRYALAGYPASVVLLLASAAWYMVKREFYPIVSAGLALTVLFAAAAVIADPDRVRRALAGRQARHGSNALVISLAFAGILGVLNFLAYSNPKRWDLTEDQEYTLAPETRLLLSTLKEPARIVGFYTVDAEGSQNQIRPLLEQYQVESKGKLTFEFIDPREDPITTERYGVTQDRSLVIVVGETSAVVTFPEEQDISGALLRLENPGIRKVYFTSGHGELSISQTDDGGLSKLKTALDSKNYETEELNLQIQGEIPADALLLVVAGPQVPLSPAETELIVDYLAQGGSLLLLQEPSILTRFGDNPDSLADYLASSWGIGLNNDLIVDPDSLNPFVALSFQYASHPVTERLESIGTLFPSARSLNLATVEGSSVTQTALVTTGDSSWGETNLEALLTDDPLEGLAEDAGLDNPGPLTVVAVAENSVSEARLVVIGDADFPANAIAFDAPNANGDLLVNSIDWASGQENLLDLTPKQQTQRFVTPPTETTVRLVFLGTVVLLPGAVIVLGVSVWWQRRKRA